MAFAIFFDPYDAAAIAGSINAATLPVTLRNLGRKYWNGGIRNWATAPVGGSPLEDPSTWEFARTIVIDGAGCTLAEFCQLLLDVGAFIGSGTVAGHYLEKLSVDCGQVGGAIEPWPMI